VTHHNQFHLEANGILRLYHVLSQESCYNKDTTVTEEKFHANKKIQGVNE
jgi:hypothetical protein